MGSRRMHPVRRTEYSRAQSMRFVGYSEMTRDEQNRWSQMTGWSGESGYSGYSEESGFTEGSRYSGYSGGSGFSEVSRGSFYSDISGYSVDSTYEEGTPRYDICGLFGPEPISDHHCRLPGFMVLIVGLAYAFFVSVPTSAFMVLAGIAGINASYQKTQKTFRLFKVMLTIALVVGLIGCLVNFIAADFECSFLPASWRANCVLTRPLAGFIGLITLLPGYPMMLLWLRGIEGKLSRGLVMPIDKYVPHELHASYIVLALMIHAPLYLNLWDVVACFLIFNTAVVGLYAVEKRSRQAAAIVDTMMLMNIVLHPVLGGAMLFMGAEWWCRNIGLNQGIVLRDCLPTNTSRGIWGLVATVEMAFFWHFINIWRKELQNRKARMIEDSRFSGASGLSGDGYDRMSGATYYTNQDDRYSGASGLSGASDGMTQAGFMTGDQGSNVQASQMTRGPTSRMTQFTNMTKPASRSHGSRGSGGSRGSSGYQDHRSRSHGSRGSHGSHSYASEQLYASGNTDYVTPGDPARLPSNKMPRSSHGSHGSRGSGGRGSHGSRGSGGARHQSMGSRGSRGDGHRSMGSRGSRGDGHRSTGSRGSRGGSHDRFASVNSTHSSGSHGKKKKKRRHSSKQQV